MENQLTKQKFSILETLIVSICLFGILGAVILGVLYQSNVNKDKIKIRNILSMARALDQYYNDSSSTEYSRKYPISQCSTTEPNSVDYEHTLFLTLSGQSDNAYKYIEPNIYPQDDGAVYRDQTDKPCTKFLRNYDKNKYSLNNKECDYTPASAKNRCYLYSSTPEGDRYILSFYSEAANKLITINKLRSNPSQYDGLNPITEEIK
jgi:type II secretory pathway pseudopilin PulG